MARLHLVEPRDGVRTAQTDRPRRIRQRQARAFPRAHLMIRGLIFGIVRIVSYRPIGFVSIERKHGSPAAYTPNT